MERHLLDIDDLAPAEVHHVLDLASAAAADLPRVLDRRGAALLFEKPSARTRNSMEIAVMELGGHPVTIRNDEVGLDTRESVEDITRTLMQYHSVVCARVFEHSVLERMVAVSSVPVVNLLSDAAHPMQTLADLLTIRGEFGGFEGVSVAYVGDANNVLSSLALGCALVGVPVHVASPEGYGVSADLIDRVVALGGTIDVHARPDDAVAGARVVYTDTWTSMGQEAEAAVRRSAFAGFGVDDALMTVAAPDAIFLHCLPAHRGEEATDSVLDGPASRIWMQAANRRHAARGLLCHLLGGRS